MQATDSRIQYIKGALWGGVLGDVIGAYLQFDKDVNALKISQAFKIIGGGKHHLEPGQPTDDTELNLSILKGLYRGKGTLNLNFIAEQMGNWYLSKPIDVGNTIRNSVPKACNMKVHQAHLCRKGARQCSQTSQSNGTLMALIGISIWCHKLPIQDVIRTIRQFTILIHPNDLVVLSNTFYALCVHYLLNNLEKEDRGIQAFYFAKEKIGSLNKEFAIWIKSIEESFKNREVIEKDAPINKASGWVRVALSYAVHFLVCSQSFKKSIEWIISQKGDTDTNACIMGGLLGTYYGYSKLDLDIQIEKIGKWNSNNKKRPEWLIPGKVLPKYIDFLSSTSPTELKIIGSEAEYPSKSPSKTQH